MLVRSPQRARGRSARALAASRLLVPLLLAAALPATGCGGADAEPVPPSAEQAGPPPAVEAVPARSGSLPLAERLSGVARAANQVQLRPEISGVVAEVLVRSGDRVVSGQPLVRLRDETEREQLQQALAAVDLAEAAVREADARVAELEAQVVRTRALAEQELISTLELETHEAQLQAAEAASAQSRARVEQTRATVEERRAGLERTVVSAPIGGTLGRAFQCYRSQPFDAPSDIKELAALTYVAAGISCHCICAHAPRPVSVHLNDILNLGRDDLDAIAEQARLDGGTLLAVYDHENPESQEYASACCPHGASLCFDDSGKDDNDSVDG